VHWRGVIGPGKRGAQAGSPTDASRSLYIAERTAGAEALTDLTAGVTWN